jgi:hypothetical protein
MKGDHKDRPYSGIESAAIRSQRRARYAVI